MSSSRELRFIEGTSSKFWRVEVSGRQHTVTYGRIGTAGASKTQTFPDAEAARASAEKLIAGKLAKGYFEVGGSAVDSAWERVEKQLKALGIEDLPPGASASALDAAERKLGVRLPDEVRASYARHDGLGTHSVLEGREFLSLQGMVAQWGIWKQLLDDGTFKDTESEPSQPHQVKSDWWNPRWIPFTHDGSGNHHCIDLDPAPGGTVGQVITMWHDDSTRRLVAGSLSEFLVKVAWER